MRLVSFGNIRISNNHLGGELNVDDCPDCMCDPLSLTLGPEAEVVVITVDVGARAHSKQCGGARNERWIRVECESHNLQEPAADRIGLEGIRSVDYMSKCGC